MPWSEKIFVDVVDDESICRDGGLCLSCYEPEKAPERESPARALVQKPTQTAVLTTSSTTA
jgi:hypothetical protein